MKAWLKGGLIAGVIDLILVALAYVTSSPEEVKLMAVGLVQYPFTSPLNALGLPNGNIFIIIIGGLVIYFIIGALIGLLVERVKSKK